MFQVRQTLDTIVVINCYPCFCNSRYYRTLEKQRQIDELEQQTLLEARENYLLCAVDNYTKCLQHSNTFDLVVFRLTSLWFENLDSDVINQRIGVSSCSFLAAAVRLYVTHAC